MVRNLQFKRLLIKLIKLNTIHIGNYIEKEFTITSIGVVGIAGIAMQVIVKFNLH